MTIVDFLSACASGHGTPNSRARATLQAGGGEGGRFVRSATDRRKTHWDATLLHHKHLPVAVTDGSCLHNAVTAGLRGYFSGHRHDRSLALLLTIKMAPFLQLVVSALCAVSSVNAFDIRLGQRRTIQQARQEVGTWI